MSQRNRNNEAWNNETIIFGNSVYFQANIANKNCVRDKKGKIIKMNFVN